MRINSLLINKFTLIIYIFDEELYQNKYTVVFPKKILDVQKHV